MATATSTEIAVFRPPPPRLGDFSKIFTTFLEEASGNAPRIELRQEVSLTLSPPCGRKIKLLESSKVQDTISKSKLSSLLHSTQSPIPNSPRMQKAARDLISGKIKEFVPSPPQDAVGDTALLSMPVAGFDLTPATSDDSFAPNSTPDTSEITLNSISTVDEGARYSTSTTTPSSSPDTVTFVEKWRFDHGGKIADGNICIENTEHTVDVAYTDNTAICNATVINGSPALAVRKNVVYSRKAVTTKKTRAVPVSPTESGHEASHTYTGAENVTHIKKSSSGLFTYVLLAQQHGIQGVKLWSVFVNNPEQVDCVVPTYMTTLEDKRRFLEFKLQSTLQTDKMTKIRHPTATNNVHVFVDLSNITIGFYDCLKAKHGIPVNKRMKAPRFSFDMLALILERGRQVEKRVVAGSVVSAYNRKYPDYMQAANDLGYEMNIMQRVSKAVGPPKKHRKMRNSKGEIEWTTSDADSTGEEAIAGHIGQLKQGEQGVDEILHLKMLQSAIDSKSGTAVLATGDAAEAEYSDGFKSNVERLLRHGWNIEIYGWSKGISSAWRDPEFVATYGERVRVIELDVYCEEIFGAWFGAPGH